MTELLIYRRARYCIWHDVREGGFLEALLDCRISKLNFVFQSVKLSIIWYQMFQDIIYIMEIVCFVDLFERNIAEKRLAHTISVCIIH